MWIVPEIGPQDTQQNSALDRFFDEQPKAVALVRETIQNSMDASVSNSEPVRVSFSYKEIQTSDLTPYFQGKDSSLMEHLKKCGISEKKGTIRALTIEDFNTEGLTGETDNTKILDETGNPISGNFIGFWWSEGQSAKRRGSGGSHGVGKVKLSTSSDYNCFLGLTKRHDDQKELLIGYSQLKVHILNKKRYRSYARFGKLADNNDPQGRLDPYDIANTDDREYVESFKKAFGLKRTSETGLSVVIPAINDEIAGNEILKAVLTDFYIPILKNKLVVEIHDGGKTIAVNADNISELTAQHLNTKDEEILRAAKKMLSLNHKGCYLTGLKSDLGDDPGRSIEMDDFNGDTLQNMQRDFSQGKMVGAKIPVTIFPKPGPENPDTKPINCLFSIFVQNNENSVLDRHSAYVRDNLYIRSENSGLGKPFSIAFVYVENEQLSEFLKYAEDPGHEKWKVTTLREKGHYRKERETLNFIKASIKNFYNVLEGVEEDEEVRGVSPEIFSITEPGTGPAKGGKSPPPPGPIKTRSKPPFAIVRKNGGFEIKNSKFLSELVNEEDWPLPFRCYVQMGYKKPFGNSVKGYNPFDFQVQDEEKFIIECANTNIKKSENNEILFEVNGEDFSLEITGFDPNRDLEVRCEVLQEGGE